MNMSIFSQALAVAEAKLIEAKARHQNASERAASTKERIAELEQRRGELQARRVNGTGQPSDDGEILLLAGDLDLLREAMTVAEAESAKLIPDSEQAAYDRAKFEFDQATKAAQLTLLCQKACEADALLVRLMNDIRDAGNGLNLSQLWMPSRMLQMSITREFPPL